MADKKENIIRVKCPASQAHLIALSAGVMRAADILDELPNSAKAVPGVTLAKSAILAEAHQHRTAMLGKNLAIIARAGHDVGHYKSIGFDPNTNELICEFYDPDLFDEQETV